MTLFAEIAAQTCPDEAAARAIEELLAAADGEPTLMLRAMGDPRMAAIAPQIVESARVLEERSAERWTEARLATAEALQHCAPWMILADGAANDAYRALESRQTEVEELAERGDPFARLDAARRAMDLAAETDMLRRGSRESIAASLREAVDKLGYVVQEAGPELKSTEEWVEAKVTVGECDGWLETAAAADEDTEAREALEQVRHSVGVQGDLLDVISMEIARREKERSERRELKQAEDRMVLKAQADRKGIINAQLAATAFLAAIFFWAGPLVLLTSLPAIFALISARAARAVLRERIWSIPKSDVDTVDDAMSTRMIVAVLLIMVIAIVLVIQWMLDNVG